MEQAATDSDVDPVAGPDPELAATMGFSGFGKKARTFDFNAMFEQTRRTAVERSRKILEEREKEAAQKEKDPGSGNDVIVPTTAPSHTTARISSRDSDSSESEDSSDEELIGPPLPPQGPVEETEDDELIGPPLPPGYKGSDDDDEEEEEEDNMQEEDEVMEGKWKGGKEKLHEKKRRLLKLDVGGSVKLTDTFEVNTASLTSELSVSDVGRNTR